MSAKSFEITDENESLNMVSEQASCFKDCQMLTGNILFKHLRLLKTVNVCLTEETARDGNY